MEPVSGVVSAILKLVREIAKAARTARRNRERCRYLAGRAEVVGSVLEESKERARADAAPARRRMLGRLKEALDDALELVESCRARGVVVSWLCAVVTSGSTAAKFDDVDRRITACLVDLGFANGNSIESKMDRLAARDRQHGSAKNPKQKKQMNAGNAPAKGGSKNGGWNKGGQNAGGQGGKRRRGKKAAAAAARPTPPPPVVSHAGVASYPNGHGYAYAVHHHSMEEDPNSCSIM